MERGRVGATMALGGIQSWPASRVPLEYVVGLWHLGWGPHWTRRRTTLATPWLGAVMAAVGRCHDRSFPFRVPEKNSPMARPGEMVRKDTVSGPVCDFLPVAATSNLVHTTVRVLEPDESFHVGGRWRRSMAGETIWRLPVQGPFDNRVG